MKRAFFGACGILLVALRDDMPESEFQSVRIMQDMFQQVADYWNNEATDMANKNPN